MKLHLENFKCWHKQSFEFPDTGVILLQGFSGGGKSSVLSSIFFVLFNQGNKLTTFGKKKCQVILDSEQFLITRTKNPNSLRLIDKRDKNNPKQYQDETAQHIIDEFYGSKNFNITSYHQQNGQKSFLSISAAEQLSFLEQLAFDNTDISKLKTVSKAEISQKKIELTSAKARHQLVDEQFKVLTRPIDTDALESQLTDKNISKNEESIDAHLNTNKIKLKEVEQSLKELGNQIEQFNCQQNTMEQTLIKISFCKSAISDLDTELQSQTANYNKIKSEYDVEYLNSMLIMVEYNKQTERYNCNEIQRIDLQNSVDKMKQEELQHWNKQIQNLTNKLSDNDQKLAGLEQQLEKLEFEKPQDCKDPGLSQMFDKMNMNDTKDIANSIGVNKSQILKYRNELSKTCTDIDKYEQLRNKTKQTEIDLSCCKQSIQEIKRVIDELDAKQEEYQYDSEYYSQLQQQIELKKGNELYEKNETNRQVQESNVLNMQKQELKEWNDCRINLTKQKELLDFKLQNYDQTKLLKRKELLKQIISTKQILNDNLLDTNDVSNLQTTVNQISNDIVSLQNQKHKLENCLDSLTCPNCDQKLKLSSLTDSTGSSTSKAQEQILIKIDNIVSAQTNEDINKKISEINTNIKYQKEVLKQKQKDLYDKTQKQTLVTSAEERLVDLKKELKEFDKLGDTSQIKTEQTYQQYLVCCENDLKTMYQYVSDHKQISKQIEAVENDINTKNWSSSLKASMKILQGLQQKSIELKSASTKFTKSRVCELSKSIKSIEELQIEICKQENVHENFLKIKKQIEKEHRKLASAEIEFKVHQQNLTKYKQSYSDLDSVKLKKIDLQKCVDQYEQNHKILLERNMLANQRDHTQEYKKNLLNEQKDIQNNIDKSKWSNSLKVFIESLDKCIELSKQLKLNDIKALGFGSPSHKTKLEKFTLDELEQEISVQRKCKDQLTICSNQIETKKQQIQKSQEQMSIHQTEYDKIEKNLSKTVDLKAKKNEMESTKININNEMDQLHLYKTYVRQLNEWEKWHDKFEESTQVCCQIESQLNVLEKFASKISQAEAITLMQWIERINFMMQNFLDMFFPDDPMSFKFNLLKETKKEVKTQISCEIFYKNENVDLKSLSGGEYSRVELAILLSLNAITTSNLLMLDENVSSLDSESTTNVIDSLKSHCKGKLIIIVAHQVVTGIFDNIIDVSKLKKK